MEMKLTPRWQEHAMKTASRWYALALLAAATGAQAYYVDGATGYPGKATIRSTGACAIPLTTHYDAWLGDVYDDSDTYQGWGIVTNSGELLALEVTGAETRYRHNSITGVGYQDYYLDIAGVALGDYLYSHSFCDPAALAPMFSSSERYRWDSMLHEKTVRVVAKVKGYDQSQCIKQNGIESCEAARFSATVTFSGTVYY
jgi:hypothetical protein